ncbi:histidine phosphatase family protein [Lacticaseibacillus zhaodongensis]|uniref:histidine phosphatase family protein n=1 Tax=Lacticaseibacillus zhaodongensis TaxID=2668065 RepID=UPI0012D2C38F|nr:histidine phosphatase family protein [Lacticaseibacillus zhaodongensis]
MKAITIYLIRHGQTYINRYDRMQGWSDTPLTDKGIADAKQAGQTLSDVHFVRAYSSDTMRAQTTAGYILAANKWPDTPFSTSPNFREQFYGYFEGDNPSRTWFVIGKPHGYNGWEDIVARAGLDAAKDMMHAADPFHDAEDAHTYWSRIMRGFKEIRDGNPDGGKVLLVTHGTSIRSIADKFGKSDGFKIDRGPANGSITQLRLDDGGVHLLAYNQKQLDD